MTVSVESLLESFSVNVELASVWFKLDSNRNDGRTIKIIPVMDNSAATKCTDVTFSFKKSLAMIAVVTILKLVNVDMSDGFISFTA